MLFGFESSIFGNRSETCSFLRGLEQAADILGVEYVVCTIS